MGCASSNFNNTFDGSYVACSTLKEGSLKRSYSNSNSSNPSSGVWSAVSNTPPKKQRSILRRCLPKAKQSASVYSNSLATEQETQKQQQQQQIDSSGYFSESMRTKSSPTTSAKNSYVMDSSSSGFGSNNSSSNSIHDFSCYGDLKLEMYMAARTPGQMPNTSSPFCERRGDGNCKAPIIKTRPTVSYQKWRNQLQTMPDCVRLNVSVIPEAIAGQFSPIGFPGYTDMQDAVDNAAKRFKSDVSATGVITTDF